ncbi:UDP-N-acetylmuramoyl-L-alanine--D-glutamate ligase [Sphingorhabdus arenilitoris]|uniref:UDP-N-acetylmuramoylalanine--D-glutamate ligase n=1 Tax=Sphingorhabdus arenilitoris TaxID=1490041 RepID=A0ABV8RH03_9SPHN
MIISPAFADRKFAILGLARSGLAAAQALAASGAQITAWDSQEDARNAAADIATIADPLEIDLSGFDGVVVSPGVPLISHPIARKAYADGVPVIGDIELFAMARPTLPAHKVVGITGTNGKSTTTALVHHMIKSAARPVRMAGNIGLPILSQKPLPAGGVYVLELSSYQIDLTRSLDCDVAALINLSPDHLDRYHGYEGYMASKARLFAMQSEKHHSIFGDSDDDTRSIYLKHAAQKDKAFCHLASTGDIKGQADWPSLQGPHNLENAAIAIEVAKALGINETQWRRSFAAFRGLEHRMEIVGEHDGVLFVNDSKATNAASTAPALAAYPRIRWILGGVPKSDNLDECAPNFGNVVKAYTIGEAGGDFERLLQPHMPVESCEMLVTAVAKAASEAQPGEVVMLSPACASFDQFKDFEARGNAFKAAFASLGSGTGR